MKIRSQNDEQRDAAVADVQATVSHLVAAYVMSRLHDGGDKAAEWMIQDARRLTKAIATIQRDGEPEQ